METTEYIIIHVTTPNKDVATKIAKHLIEHHLVACINIIPEITSTYWWENKVQTDTEVLMIIKTKKILFDKVATAIKTLHTYTVPEIIAIPIIGGNTSYLQWLGEATRNA